MTHGYDRQDVQPIDYVPSLTEQSFKSLIRHLREELGSIAISINTINTALQQPVHVEPALPQKGMIRFVDAGDVWNPDASGLGGFFGYDGADWILLGR